MSLIRLGYFENFKSSNTLLLDAEHDGISQLERALRMLATGEVASLAINSLPFVEAQPELELVASLAAHDHGVSKSGLKFRWHRTKEGWLESAEKVSAIRQYEACHQYLYGPEDEASIMVSVGEYGLHWWQSHA